MLRIALLLIPATVYCAWLAQSFFEGRRARIVQILVGLGTSISIALAGVAEFRPNLWADVLVPQIAVLSILRIVLPSAIMGFTLLMAFNYLRVASGRLRGSIDIVCGLLMSWSVYVEDAVVSVSIVISVLAMRWFISARQAS